MRIDDTDAWAQTKDVIIGLYPKWNLTIEQAKAFREEFQPLWQPALREAIRRLWLEDKFGKGTLSPGRLKAMYGRVRAQSEAAHRASAHTPDDEVDYGDIKLSHENLLRRVLMAPISAVTAAAQRIREGVGRWGWIKPQKNEGDNPTKWSAMMRSAVMYEMENPSTEAEDATDSSEPGRDQPDPEGVGHDGNCETDDRAERTDNPSCDRGL